MPRRQRRQIVKPQPYTGFPGGGGVEYYRPQGGGGGLSMGGSRGINKMSITTGGEEQKEPGLVDQLNNGINTYKTINKAYDGGKNIGKWFGDKFGATPGATPPAQQCGVTHGYANLIALKFREADAASSEEDELVTSQYKGKEALLPIYQALHQFISKLADDVEVSPKKNAVSFRRKRQFALVQPSTKTRIDLGLKFNNRDIAGRLEGSGPFGTMCSHRIQVTDISQVDAELFNLIKEAYLEAG